MKDERGYAAANHSFLPSIRCCQWGNAAAKLKWSMVNSQWSMVNEKEGSTRPQTIRFFFKSVVANGGTRPQHPLILFIRVPSPRGRNTQMVNGQ